MLRPDADRAAPRYRRAMLWLVAAALAQDPLEDQVGRLLRAEHNHLLYGSADLSSLTLAAQLESSSVQSDWWRDRYYGLYAFYEPEDLLLDGRARKWYEPVVGFRSWGRVSVGDGRTQNLAGDAESGLISARVGADVVAATPWFEAHASPQVRLDVIGTTQPVSFPLVELWGGVRRGPVRAGFGLEQRHVGPGRHSSLILGRDAAPFPMGDVAVEGQLPKLGRVRAHVGAGWLQSPRLDVSNPGILLMDVRWSPVPWVEVGASRLSLFGGQGRPMPSVGQLMLPLDPHVYDDPDLDEPDQDEIAALDVRVHVPLPGPLDYLEVYTQYGGDDMIVQRLGPAPVPSLAGIANLFGGELSAGPLFASLEWANVRDDRFRWYTGHRVYHQGFTQDSRWLGHVNGGDQTTWWARVGAQPGPIGGVLWFEHVERTLVLDVLGDSVLAGVTEERRVRGGVQVRWFRPKGGLLVGGYEIERITGRGFVPGDDATLHRVTVTWQGAPWTVFGADNPDW